MVTLVSSPSLHALCCLPVVALESLPHCKRLATLFSSLTFHQERDSHFAANLAIIVTLQKSLNFKNHDISKNVNLSKSGAFMSAIILGQLIYYKDATAKLAKKTD